MIRLCSLVCLTAVLASARPTGKALLDQGYSDMYNLRFDEAHRAFAKYQSMQPEDPLGPVSDAAAYLFSEFDRLHILQSEFFVNDRDFLSAKKKQPDSEAKSRFEEDLAKTHRLAASQKRQPNECANAVFASILALGLKADYEALIERRDVAALRQINNARELAEKLLSKHPTYYDAYIAIGIENYLLGRKPALVRWLLRVRGAETDKQMGIDKLRLVAEHGHYLRPYAHLLLAIAAVRDGDKNDARKLLSWLTDRYPKNSLYRHELVKLR